MRAIWIAQVCGAVIGASILVGCAKNYAAEGNALQSYADTCTKVSVPSAEQIRTMPTDQLYEFWQLSRRASDQWASDRALNRPTDPCVAAMAWKKSEYERELKS